MKNLYSTLLGAFLLMVSVPPAIQAQGLIVNEISNGDSGSKEYVEFVVVGNATQKTGFVNLKGWIIDDNGGGALSPSQGSAGIAAGHYRLGECFENIPIGAIIVVYNAADKYGGISIADDPTDANGDSVYVFSSLSTCFEMCSAYPTSSAPSYGLPGCGTTGYKPVLSTSWTNYLALNNSTDGFQTRQPDGTLYHALGYGMGALAAGNIHFELGAGIAVNNRAGGSGSAVMYSCGSLSLDSNYLNINYADGTPGEPNNLFNTNFINNVRSGLFDYNNWGDVTHCAITMPLHLTSFGVAPKSMQYNELNWTLEKVDPYSYVEIERSRDGIRFEKIHSMDLIPTFETTQYQYMDYTPYLTTYYRLKFIEPNAPISYSETRVVTHRRVNEQNVAIYPNPTKEQLTIALQEAIEENIQYEVIDILGRVLLQGEIAAYQNFAQIAVSDLASGNYYLRLSGEQIQMTRKFIKN